MWSGSWSKLAANREKLLSLTLFAFPLLLLLVFAGVGLPFCWSDRLEWVGTLAGVGGKLRIPKISLGALNGLMTLGGEGREIVTMSVTSPMLITGGRVVGSAS